MIGLTPVSFKKGREHKPRLSAPYVPGRRSARFWSVAEDQVLRDRFPKGGAPLCEEALPRRTRGSIYQRAAALGVKPPKGGARHGRIVPPEDADERIKAAWGGKQEKGFSFRLAAELGVPKWWLCKRATALGLSTRRLKEPDWTRAEEELMRKVPLHDPVRCARIFREHGFTRTPTSIVVKAKRLELSRRGFWKADEVETRIAEMAAIADVLENLKLGQTYATLGQGAELLEKRAKSALLPKHDEGVRR